MADYSVTYDQLDALLQGLDPNTADTPYEIEITEVTRDFLLGGGDNPTSGTLRYVLCQNPNKYVSLTWGANAISLIEGLSSIGQSYEPNYFTPINFLWGATSLVSIDMSHFIGIRGFWMNSFAGCTSLKSLDLSNLTLIESTLSLANRCTSLESVNMAGLSSVYRMENAFVNCVNLRVVNMAGCDNIENSSMMFYGCSSLTSIALPEMSKNMNVKGMFSGCTSLEEIHNWTVPLEANYGNISGSEDLRCFANCPSLQAIYTSPADTPPQESSWRAWDIRKDTANNQSTVTVYNPDGTSNSVSVPSSGDYTMKVTDKVDELLFSPSESISAATIQKMLQTKAPITARDALDPTRDNFVLLAKDRSSARTNVTTDVIEAGNKLPPTSEAVRAAIGQMGLIMYPVGSIYMSVNSINPENIFGGTWERLPDGVFIRNAGGDANPVGEVQNEGLPNIIGSLYGMQQNKGGGTSGAFSRSGGSGNNEGTYSGFGSYDISFNARSSNSIYGASSHVTTYNTAVYIWKRIA